MAEKVVELMENIYGMYIVFGFAAACAIIFAAKFIMAKALQRKETYYDEGGDA